MIFKFQIVITDIHDYVLEFRDFFHADIKAMIDYVAYWATRKDGTVVIKITRWDKEGNRV